MIHEKSMQYWVREAIVRHTEPSSGRCPEGDQLLNFYSDRLDQAEIADVREHLVACARCRGEARLARSFLSVMCEPAGVRAARFPTISWMRTRTTPFLLASAALVVLSIGAAFLFWRTRQVEIPPLQQARSTGPQAVTSDASATNPWRDLVVAKADYSPPIAGPDDMFYRDGKPEPEAQSTLPLAMEPYERDDFAETERRLAELLARNPRESEAHFYRGVSLLMLGRTAEAIAPLQAAIRTGEGAAVAEARWYLALALLKHGQPTKALEQLDSLSAAPGAHRAEAGKIRQEVLAKMPEPR